MKNLKEFQNEKVSLKNIWGGGEIQTSSQTKNSEGCTVTKSDIVDDANNNGKRDKGESYSECITVIC